MKRSPEEHNAIKAGRTARLDNLPRAVPLEYADMALEWHEGWEEADTLIRRIVLPKAKWIVCSSAS